MAKKNSTGKTLLYVGVGVVGAIALYELLKPKTTVTVPTVTTTGTSSTSTNPVTQATSLLSSITKLFGGSSSSSGGSSGSSSSSGGGATYITDIAGEGDSMSRLSVGIIPGRRAMIARFR